QFELLRCAALARPPRERLRIDVLPRLDVPRRDALVPRSGSTAGNRDDSCRVDTESRLDPAKKRNPVQRLEADFRQPRPHHDRSTTVHSGVKLTLDLPCHTRPLQLLTQFAPVPQRVAKRTLKTSPQTHDAARRNQGGADRPTGDRARRSFPSAVRRTRVWPARGDRTGTR